MLVWSEKENRFLQFPYKVHGFKLSTKIRFTATLVTFLAFAEYLCYVSNTTHNFYKNNFIDHAGGFWSQFLRTLFPYIFNRIPFNLPLGIFLECMNFSYTLAWNYMELFFMMISIAIYTRFSQINDRLNGIRGMESFQIFYEFLKFENSHSRLFQKRFGARSEWITSSCVNFWNVLITNFDF